jgi:hypothetical protein
MPISKSNLRLDRFSYSTFLDFRFSAIGFLLAILLSIQLGAAPAIAQSNAGVWVGTAMIDSVTSYETRISPARTARPGRPEGIDNHDSALHTVHANVKDGKLSHTHMRRYAFNEEGRILLGGANYAKENIKVSGTLDGQSTTLKNPENYILSSSNTGHLIDAGGDYSPATSIEISGGGGQGAKAEMVLDGYVQSIELLDPGTGEFSPQDIVTITGGGGTGALAQLDVTRGGVITGVSMISWGQGYTSAPTVVITSDYSGKDARAKAHIKGPIGKIIVIEGGSGYTKAPVVTVVSETGRGAKAQLFVSPEGRVIGVDAIDKSDGRVALPVDDTGRQPLAPKPQEIEDEVSITVTTHSVAPEDSVEGLTDTSAIIETYDVTQNGKTHTVTTTQSVGNSGSQTASTFPVRIVLFIPEDGRPVLLQQVFLGQTDGTNGKPKPVASKSEAAITKLLAPWGLDHSNQIIRVSSASFPLGQSWTSAGQSSTWHNFKIDLGHDDDNNPFVHRYHPDHDNFDARYENKLPEGVETFRVTRDVNVVLREGVPNDPNPASYGLETVRGTYSEKISGLRSDDIRISGSVTLHRVSKATTLLDN